MFKVMNLVKVCIIMAFTVMGISLSPAWAEKKVPAYYRYYHPNQIHDTWIDLNNNGVMDPYENTKLRIEDRIEDLLSRMTLDEKVARLPCPRGFEGEGVSHVEVAVYHQPSIAWVFLNFAGMQMNHSTESNL